MNLPRDKKRVHFMSHFFDKVIEEKLFSSTNKAKNMTIKAVKENGIIIPTPTKRDDCDCFCIFMGDAGFLVVVPLLETLTDFICRTVFKAEKWHRKIYKNERLNNFNKKEG